MLKLKHKISKYIIGDVYSLIMTNRVSMAPAMDERTTPWNSTLKKSQAYDHETQRETFNIS